VLSYDQVQAKGGTLRKLRKLVLAGATLTMAASGIHAGIASAQAVPLSGPGIEGCMILDGSDTCSYKPTMPGGFFGIDFASVTIYRLETETVNGTTTQVDVAVHTFTISDSVPDAGCAMWTPAATGAPYTNIDKVVGQGSGDLTTDLVFGSIAVAPTSPPGCPTSPTP
jgi:hypothetical protein